MHMNRNMTENKYRIFSIKPPGGLLILRHQKGDLLEGEACLIFQVKVRKKPKPKTDYYRLL